jgi:CheY-like chemotaxis protein
MRSGCTIETKLAPRLLLWKFLKSRIFPSKPLNILVVDDEFGIRASLGVVLALAGHHAVFAKDGEDALELFDQAQVPFDRIITDHQMFRVSGLELVRKLRKRGFAGEILVVTAYAEIAEEQEYRELQVSGILKKPFDTAELRRQIETCRAPV